METLERELSIKRSKTSKSKSRKQKMSKRISGRIIGGKIISSQNRRQKNREKEEKKNYNLNILFFEIVGSKRSHNSKYFRILNRLTFPGVEPLQHTEYVLLFLIN